MSTVFYEVKGASHDVDGGEVTAGKTSHCGSGTIPVQPNNTYCCSRKWYFAGGCKYCRKCTSTDGSVFLKNANGDWSSTSVKISDLCPKADSKELVDLDSQGYFLVVKYKNITSDILKSDFNDEIQTTYQVYNSMTPLQQVVVSVSGPTPAYPGSIGFCSKVVNINSKVITTGGVTYTCDTISNLYPSFNIDRLNEEKTFCGVNPKDPKCSCYNIDRPDVDSFCQKNQTFPGCDEYMQNLKPLKAAGISGAWSGGAKCLASNSCLSGVYIPATPPGDCNVTLDVCNQINNFEDVKAQNITVYNQCKEKMDNSKGAKGGSTPGPSRSIPILSIILIILSAAILLGLLLI